MTDDELLTWPTFSANQYELAKNLKEKGYHVQHHGRSGFDTRNTYEISTVDGVISKEAVETINKDISDFYKQQEKAKLKQVDDMFEKNILDKEGIFSFVELGGEASNPWDYDRNKYTCVSSYRYMNYKDYRLNRRHIYRYILADKNRLEQNGNKVIELSTSKFPGLFEKAGYELAELSEKYNFSIKGKNEDGFVYISRGSSLKNVFWLDLDLSKPEDMQKALTQNSLHWPSFSALDKKLAGKLEEKGYVCEKIGRSGFDSRNHFNVMTKDGKLTPEILEQLNQAVEDCRNILDEEKIRAFDQYFDEQSPDKDKVYSVVETGKDFYLTRTQDYGKYDTIASEIVAFTADSRRNVGHAYKELLIHKERIKADKRHVITLEVPQKMIGLVIGKGGATIKTLSQKYGKHFKVIQDPKEAYRNNLTELHETFSAMLNNGTALSFDLSLSQYPWLNEKDKKELQEKFSAAIIEKYKQKEKEAQIKHERDIYTVTSHIMSHLGDMTSLPENEVTLKLAAFLQENKDNADIIPVLPNLEELRKIKQEAIERREKQIKEQQVQKEVERQRFMEAVHDKMLDTMKETGKVIDAEKLTEFMDTNFEGKDSVLLQEFKQEASEERTRREQKLSQDIETLRKIYYKVIANEITNVNGEIHRRACESKKSASRVFSALYDQAEAAGLKEEFYYINITDTPKNDSEAELYTKNVEFMEELVIRDIEGNGGYYRPNVCFYTPKSLKKKTVTKKHSEQEHTEEHRSDIHEAYWEKEQSGQEHTEEVPPVPQISLKEAKAQAKGQKIKGKTNNLADLAALINRGESR